MGFDAGLSGQGQWVALSIFTFRKNVGEGRLPECMTLMQTQILNMSKINPFVGQGFMKVKSQCLSLKVSFDINSQSQNLCTKYSPFY